jgi:hypothetical protein
MCREAMGSSASSPFSLSFDEWSGDGGESLCRVKE